MKKHLPIDLLKQIQPMIAQQRNLIVVTASDKLAGDWLLELTDVDAESKFFFKIKYSFLPQQFTINLAPRNRLNTQSSAQDGSLAIVIKKLEEWFAILKDYSITPSIDDDPILRSYEAEFADYFTIQDEDADEAPLDLPRQLYLNEYLEQMEEKLAERIETADPVQKTQLLLIEQECASLREGMGEMTKSQTAKKLASIMAKARKFSIGLVKEFFAEFKKEAYKQIAKGIIEIDLPSMGDVLGSIGPGIQ